MVVGVLGVLVGSTLVAMATYRTAALSRGAAMTLGVASVLMIPAGFSGNTFGPVPAIVAGIGFALGWFVLGISAIRLDRPATAPQPA
jgi:predicted tellurium resistance membrane protein TerC